MSDQEGLLDDLFARLQAAAPHPQQYSAIDRRRDFRAVFETEQGRRVLHQIFAWCHMGQCSFIPGHGSDVALFRDGERNVALKILSALYGREEVRPTTATTKKGT
jgi:hypothetical protein